MRTSTERRLHRDVARRAGCEPGTEWTNCHCAYCEFPLLIIWECGREPEFVMCMDGSRLPSARMAHLDHIIPESKNGPTSLDNTVIACGPCNIAKGASAFGDPGFLEWLSARRALLLAGVVL